MKLTLKLTIAFVALMALVTLIVAMFAARMEWLIFRSAHESVAEEITDRCRDTLYEAWNDQGTSGPANRLKQMTSPAARVVQVDWVWFNQQTSLQAEVDVTTMAIGRKITMIDDLRRIHTYVPLIKDGEQMGGLDVSGTLAGIDDRMRRIWWTSLSAIAAMFLLSAVVMAWLGARMVGRPLQKLVEKTQQVVQGKYDRPLNVQGTDEIASVAAALDEMCQQLQSQRERIETETEARIAALNQLRHADRLQTIGQLASGIAHEMGTPLNVIQGHADLIQSQNLTPEETRESTQTIRNEVNRMTGIVRQLLNLARRKSGLQEPTDLAKLLRETTELLHTVAHQQSVNLLLEFELEAAIVFADPEQLKQVFINLMMNAIQAMPDGGNIEIIVRESRQPRASTPATDQISSKTHWIVVTIQDHGTGIESAHMKKIFEPFFTTKQAGEGTGLGLSIAYGIVREHGGWIEATSEAGEGTRFEIGLPVMDNEIRSESTSPKI